MKLEFLYKLISYMLLALGSVLLLWDDIDYIIARYRLRHRLKALRNPDKKLPEPLNYIEHLIDASFNKKNSKRFFILFEALLFLISYNLSYRNFSALVALFVSSITIALPILFLTIRLETSRTKASKEGISLVSELYRQYRINNLNIYEAIEKTIDSKGDFKLSSKYLFNLLIHIRESRSPIELYDAIDRFTFSFGTSWAKMLGQCIKLSAENGTDISAGLADISQQLKEAYSLEEKRRMLNNEASRMTLLLVPLMYIICMLVAVFYLDIKPSILFVNQFLNPSGFLLFLINIFLFFINFVLLYVVNSEKLDF